jgi:hypothetical protein
MVFLVVGLIREMSAGDRFALGCVLGGLVAMSVADSTYAYLSEVGRYTVGQLVDVGWVAGYLGLALGAFGASGAEGLEPARGPAPTGLRIEVAVGRKLYRSDWFIAMALVVLSLARQLLIFLEQVLPVRGVRPTGAGEGSG